MMTTGFKIDRHQPIKRLTTYNLHCRKCHPGVEMDFFQNLQLKYKFWAVNSVTFISTLILVLVALGVEQDRIHTERKRLAAELVIPVVPPALRTGCAGWMRPPRATAFPAARCGSPPRICG